MIDMTKKYIYRNGEPARVLCVDRPNEDWPVLAMTKEGLFTMHTVSGFHDWAGRLSPLALRILKYYNDHPEKLADILGEGE
jgi:hypothetical protein